LQIKKLVYLQKVSDALRQANSARSACLSMILIMHTLGVPIYGWEQTLRTWIR